MLCEKFLWAIKSCFVKFSFKPLNHALWNLICKISNYALWNSLWVPKVCLKTYFVVCFLKPRSMLCQTFLRDIKYALRKLKVCFVNPQSMFCETYLRNKESNSNTTAALPGTKRDWHFIGAASQNQGNLGTNETKKFEGRKMDLRVFHFICKC